MKKIIGLFCLGLVFFRISYAQEWNTMVKKKVVILSSTKDYYSALKVARQASYKLNRKLLLDTKPHKETGMTHDREFCETYGYPCYIPRAEGSADDTFYISIEYSNAYERFAKGYYIVVAAVADENSQRLKNTLSLARKYYPDAYAKTTRVFFGCMH